MRAAVGIVAALAAGVILAASATAGGQSTLTTPTPAKTPSLGELSFSSRDADPDVTVLVAGKRVSLIATLFDFSDKGCAGKDFAAGDPLTAKLTLPAGVTLDPGEQASRVVEMPAKFVTRKWESFNIVWHVTVAERALYPVHVSIAGTSTAGLACASDAGGHIAGVSGTPSIRVVGVAGDRGGTLVAVQYAVPGLPKLSTIGRSWGTQDAIQDEHAPIDADDAGKGALNLVTLRWGGRTHLPVSDLADINVPGIDCVNFDPIPAPRARVTYHVAYTWNRYKGFGTVSKTASLPVRSSITGTVGRACARLEALGR